MFLTRIPLRQLEMIKGKDALKPTYEQDFAGGSAPVTVVGTVAQVEGNGVRVSLLNPNMLPTPKVIEVTYFFDDDKLMWKHEVHGVTDAQ